MVGSDIAMCCASCSADGSSWGCTDSYATAESYPAKDTQQDWIFVKASTVTIAGGVTARRTEMSRLLDTGDVGQDRVIDSATPLPQLLIFAKGPSETPGYHGKLKWRTKVLLNTAASGGITDPSELIMAAKDYAIVADLRNPNLPVPVKVTEYHEQYWRTQKEMAPYAGQSRHRYLFMK